MKFLLVISLILLVLLHCASAEEKKNAETTKETKEAPAKHEEATAKLEEATAKHEEPKVEEPTTKRIVTLELASTERTISLSDAECKAMEAFFSRPSTRVHRDLREKFRQTCSFGVIG